MVLLNMNTFETDLFDWELGSWQVQQLWVWVYQGVTVIKEYSIHSDLQNKSNTIKCYLVSYSEPIFWREWSYHSARDTVSIL